MGVREIGEKTIFSELLALFLDAQSASDEVYERIDL